MTFNARCWRPRLAVLAIAMLWLTAGAMGSSDAQPPCPPVVEYSATDQTRAAAETETLPEGAP